jgi:hypothetical protein
MASKSKGLGRVMGTATPRFSADRPPSSRAVPKVRSTTLCSFKLSVKSKMFAFTSAW